MGVRQRTFSRYQPRRRRDQNADRRQSSTTQLGTITATDIFNIFRAPSNAKIIQISLLADSAVTGLNESYWSFQIKNRTRGNLTLFATTPTTQPDAGSNAKGTIAADTNYNLDPDQNLWLQSQDVLALELTKTASAPDITRLAVTLEYEIEEGPLGGTTTSTSTTTTTTTTTTTSTTVTTTSSSTTTTSSSTTTTSSSTTTTTTVSTTTTVTTTSSSTSTTTTITASTSVTTTSSSTTVTTTSSSTTTTSSSTTTTVSTSTSVTTTMTWSTSTSTTVTTTSSSTTTTTSTTTTVTTTSSSITTSTSTTVT